MVNLDPAKVVDRVSECVRSLMEAGLSFEAFQVPINDQEVRHRLVNYWMAGAPEIKMELPKVIAIHQEPSRTQIKQWEKWGWQHILSILFLGVCFFVFCLACAALSYSLAH